MLGFRKICVQIRSLLEFLAFSCVPALELNLAQNTYVTHELAELGGLKKGFDQCAKKKCEIVLCISLRTQ